MTGKVLEAIDFIVPVYGSKVTFIVFKNSWREVINLLKEKGFDTKEYRGWDYVYGLQLSEHIHARQHFVVIVKKDKKFRETLVHELFHLTQDILEYKDVQFVKGGANEPYAYLMGALYTKIQKLLK